MVDRFEHKCVASKNVIQKQPFPSKSDRLPAFSWPSCACQPFALPVTQNAITDTFTSTATSPKDQLYRCVVLAANVLLYNMHYYRNDGFSHLPKAIKTWQLLFLFGVSLHGLHLLFLRMFERFCRVLKHFEMLTTHDNPSRPSKSVLPSLARSLL